MPRHVKTNAWAEQAASASARFHCELHFPKQAKKQQQKQQQQQNHKKLKSGSVLYNFIDTKLNFDTNRLSAVCKHDICCTRASRAKHQMELQHGCATMWPRVASFRPTAAGSGSSSSSFFRRSALAMLIAKRSIILFGADVAGDKSAW